MVKTQHSIFLLWKNSTFILLFLYVIFFIPSASCEGIYTSTAHGNSTAGVDRSVVTGSTYPYAKGNCAHCHEIHASLDGQEPQPPSPEGPTLFSLFRSNFGANKNMLCFDCHENFKFGSYPFGYGRHGVYEGKTTYENSTHNLSTNMVWPDSSPPGPPINDPGNCVNCHNPHGYADANGLIPSMLFSREENLCLACHDGSPVVKDVKTFILTKTYRHQVNSYTNIHRPGILGADEENRTYLSQNKHVECVDCHNPHAATQDNPIYRAPGVTPIYSSNAFWQAPSSYTETKVNSKIEEEYKVCFRCHSSYNQNLAGWNSNWTDVALEFNPNNYSYHYVMGDITTAAPLPPNGSGCNSYGPMAGSTQIPRASQTYGNFNLTYIGMMEPSLAGKSNAEIRQAKLRCSSCHGPDNAGASGTPEGPHGSSYQFILKVPAGSPYNRWNSSVNYKNNKGTIWCFNCHDPNFTNTGFSRGNENLHLKEHDDRACQLCHTAIPHGWKRYRLLRFGNCDPSPYNRLGNSGLLSGVTWKTSGNWERSDCHRYATGSGC